MEALAAFAALATASGEEERCRPKSSGDDFGAACALEAAALLAVDGRRDAGYTEQRSTVRAAAAGEARGASGGLDVVVVLDTDADAESEQERADDDACIVGSLSFGSSRLLRAQYDNQSLN